MTHINLRSASPVSSISSREDISEAKTAPQNLKADSTTVATTPSEFESLDEESTISDSSMTNHQGLLAASAVDGVSFGTNPSKHIPTEHTTSTNNHTFNADSSAPNRAVPRIHTRQSSLSTTADLPWKVDNTSSPSTWADYNTPTHHRRSSSIAPPPRASEMARTNSNPEAFNSSHSQQVRQHSPHGHVSASPSRYMHSNHYSVSPYSSNPSPSNTRPSTPPHIHSLTHPPGYHQNTQAVLSNTAGNTLYASNTSPLYTAGSNFQLPNTAGFSPSPTRGRGRGILDNDPSIYLGNGEQDTDETMWDTATKWAKFAGKRLSVGENALWKLVGGEER